MSASSKSPLEEQLKPLREMQKSISSFSSAIKSVAQFSSNEYQYQQFIKRIREYEETEHGLTNAEIESLVLLIDSGKNSYEDLITCVPHLNSATLC